MLKTLWKKWKTAPDIVDRPAFLPQILFCGFCGKGGSAPFLAEKCGGFWAAEGKKTAFFQTKSPSTRCFHTLAAGNVENSVEMVESPGSLNQDVVETILFSRKYGNRLMWKAQIVEFVER